MLLNLSTDKAVDVFIFASLSKVIKMEYLTYVIFLLAEKLINSYHSNKSDQTSRFDFLARKKKQIVLTRIKKSIVKIKVMAWNMLY